MSAPGGCPRCTPAAGPDGPLPGAGGPRVGGRSARPGARAGAPRRPSSAHPAERAVQERLEAGERDRHVLAAEAEPEVVAGVAEDRARRDQHALRLDQVLRRTRRSGRRRAAPGSRPTRRAAGPSATVRPAARRSRRAARGCRVTIRARAGQDTVPGPQRDQREDLRRRRRADRRVVLERGAARSSSPASCVASQPIRSPAIANDFDMTPSEPRAGRRPPRPAAAASSISRKR